MKWLDRKDERLKAMQTAIDAQGRLLCSLDERLTRFEAMYRVPTNQAYKSVFTVTEPQTPTYEPLFIQWPKNGS